MMSLRARSPILFVLMLAVVVAGATFFWGFRLSCGPGSSRRRAEMS